MKPGVTRQAMQTSRPKLLLLVTHSVRAFGAAASSIATLCLLSDLGQAESRALLVTTYMLCRQIPFLISSLAVGVFPRSCKQLWNMMTCEALTAASALVLSVATKPSQLATVFVLLMMQRTLAVLFDAARRSLVVECLATEAVCRSQQWDGMVWGLFSALGMVLGGALVAMWGTSSCFLLDAACRVISVVLLLCMDTRPAGWAEVPQHEKEVEEDEEFKGPPALSSSVRYRRVRGSVRTLCGAVGYVRGTEGTLKLSMIKGSAAFVYGASELVSWGHSESFAGLPRGVVLGVIMSALPLACWMNAVLHYVLARKSLVLPLPHVVVVAMALAAVGSALQTICSGLVTVFLCSFLRALACACVWAVACSAQAYPENPALVEAVQALDDATCRTSKILGLASLGLIFCTYDLCVLPGLEVLAGVTGLLALIWLTLLLRPDLEEWDEEVELTMIHPPRRSQSSRKPRRTYSWMKLASVPEEDEQDVEEEADSKL